MGCIVNGDADAVRPLMERHRRPLAAMLQRALGSDADDVFQETWIRVVRSAHRYDPEQRFGAWLFAIAWNLVKDRWSRRVVVSVDDVDVAAMASPARTPEESAVASERAERVRDVVSRLPERLAQAILLRYFEELSEREVAERLGIPVGTVKSRIHHGLRLMRESNELQ